MSLTGKNFSSEAARKTIADLLSDRGNQEMFIARFGKYMEFWKTPTLERFWYFLEEEAFQSMSRAAASRPAEQSFDSVLDEVGFGKGASRMENVAHLLEAFSRYRNNKLDAKDTMAELAPEFRLQTGAENVKHIINNILESRGVDRSDFRSRRRV